MGLRRMIKMGVCPLYTHERRKHWCVLHGFNLPVIMILLGVSKRAVAESVGGSFDRNSDTTKCLKSQRHYVYHLSINRNNYLVYP